MYIYIYAYIHMYWISGMSPFQRTTPIYISWMVIQAVFSRRCIHIYIYVHRYLYLYMYIFIHRWREIYIHKYMYIYAYTYMYWKSGMFSMQRIDV